MFRVPVGPRSLSVLEEAAVLFLPKGGLRPCAALWTPVSMPVSRGFGMPLGCLIPTIKLIH